MYNVKKIFRINKIVCAVQALITALLFVFLSIFSYNITNALSSLNESSFVQSGYTNGLRATNSYYCDLKPIDISNGENIIFTDCLLTSNDVSYKGNYLTKYNSVDIDEPSLYLGECSISKNVAKEYKIKAGDKLNIHSNFKDYDYVVKYIFDDYYGFHSIDQTTAKNLIILGYNEELITNMFSYGYYTLSDEVTTFASEGTIFDKEYQSNQLNLNMIMYCTGYMIVCSIITLLVELIFTGSLSHDLKVSKKYVYTRRKQISYILIDSAYKYLVLGFASCSLFTVVLLLIRVFSVVALISGICACLISFVLSAIFQIVKNRKVL